MLKLITHAFVAGLVFGITGKLELSIYIRIALVIAGLFAVHFVWERFFFNPFLYLGARPIDPEDPLMKEAREEGKRTFPEFAKIYPSHISNSIVKFGFLTDSGKKEFLWGDLLELNENSAKVFIRTPPVNHKGEIVREIIISTEDIIDWQVEFQDGTLRGGFTNLAMFKIFEREEGYMHPKFLEQVKRFKTLTKEEIR